MVAKRRVIPLRKPTHRPQPRRLPWEPAGRPGGITTSPNPGYNPGPPRPPIPGPPGVMPWHSPGAGGYGKLQGNGAGPVHFGGTHPGLGSPNPRPGHPAHKAPPTPPVKHKPHPKHPAKPPTHRPGYAPNGQKLQPNGHSAAYNLKHGLHSNGSKIVPVHKPAHKPGTKPHTSPITPPDGGGSVGPINAGGYDSGGGGTFGDLVAGVTHYAILAGVVLVLIYAWRKGYIQKLSKGVMHLGKGGKH